VLNGSAFKNKGVQPLLDAVVAYLPSPLDLPPVKGMNLKGDEELERKPSDDEPFSALAFKIMTDPHGKLTYFRVYSGVLEKGAGAQHPHRQQGAHRPHPRDARQRPRGRRRRLRRRHRGGHRPQGHPHRRHAVRSEKHPIVLEQLEFPEPVIHVAVEPKTKADQDKLAKALYSLSEEDPTFQVRTDDETGQTVISGMGELHLEVLVDRMLREFNVDATVGKPQVAYRETITQPVEKSTYTHKKQTGGSGQFAEVEITSSRPAPVGATSSSTRSPVAASRRSTSPRSMPASRSRSPRVLAGYPMVDVRVTLTDGKYHDVDSSEMAFKIAGVMAFKEAARKAKPVLLEPIMKVEVVTPDDYLGDVMGDLSARRGKLGQGTEQRGNSQVITRPGPPVGDVRLRYRPAFAHPGSSHLHDAVRLLPADALQTSRKRSSPASAASGPRTPPVPSSGTF
jgi:elongation factor G